MDSDRPPRSAVRLRAVLTVSVPTSPLELLFDHLHDVLSEYGLGSAAAAW